MSELNFYVVNLISILEREFKVKFIEKSNNNYYFYGHGKNNIKGWIMEYKGETTIFIDNAKCFNKASQCPIQLAIPKNKRQLNTLVRWINFIRSNKGLKISRYYNYSIIDKYCDNNIYRTGKINKQKQIYKNRR